jgi:hypothetical protein
VHEVDGLGDRGDLGLAGLPHLGAVVGALAIGERDAEECTDDLDVAAAREAGHVILDAADDAAGFGVVPLHVLGPFEDPDGAWRALLAQGNGAVVLTTFEYDHSVSLLGCRDTTSNEVPNYATIKLMVCQWFRGDFSISRSSKAKLYTV